MKGTWGQTWSLTSWVEAVPHSLNHPASSPKHQHLSWNLRIWCLWKNQNKSLIWNWQILFNRCSMRAAILPTAGVNPRDSSIKQWMHKHNSFRKSWFCSLFQNYKIIKFDDNLDLKYQLVNLLRFTSSISKLCETKVYILFYISAHSYIKLECLFI